MLKIAMDYKHNRRLPACRICKKMTGLWRRSLVIQRLQHAQQSHWCSTRTSPGLENPHHLWGPNPNSAQLRKVFVISHAVTERDEERRRVASSSPAHPFHPGVGQTMATASPGRLHCVSVPWDWWQLDLTASRFTSHPARKELLWLWSARSLLGGQNIPCVLKIAQGTCS